ncbi:MAG TPA: tetratricopeptide repeat protein, partial [Pyrinomonadaceae bacterium]|nr:tetratricopeptide repeat protein [Pyrinomonadaceae bacterium]
ESEKAEKDKARAAQITADEQAQIARDQRTEADAARQDAVNALAAAQTAERKATDALNKLNAEVANDHRNRDALASFQRGNLEEAEAKLAALLPVYRNEPQRQAWVYSYLGAARRRLGKLDESIADLKTAQGIQGRQLKGDDAEYLDTITWLGLAHSDKGNYDLAQPLYESALKIRRGGGKHTYVAVSLEHLARNYNNLGQVEEAAKHYEEALNFRRKNPSSPDLIAALKEVAEFHLELGDSEGAIKLYEEALGNQEKYLEPDDPNIADTFAAMAQVYEESPYKGQAKQLNALARGIRALNRYRDDSAEKMNHTAEVAWTYAVIGRFQQAARLRVRAQEVEDRRAGPDSHGAAYDLIRLGDFFRSAAQLAPEADDRKKFYADAASTYQRALDISERKSDGKSKLEALDGLAGLHLDQKNFAEAARFYKIALDIREQTQQASDIRLSVVKDGHKAEMAVSLDGLAQAAAGLGQNAEAEAYFLRTQKVFDDMSDFMLNYVGGVSPTMLFLRHATRARLAEFYRGQGRVKEADEQYRPLARRLKEVRRDYLTHEGIAQSYLDIIEGAGRFYTERGDTAAAESFYRLVWPEGVAPSVSVIPVWPEELYEKTMMAIAPASSIDKMIRILESYAALLEKAGRERDAGLISHGVVRLQWRKLAEGVLPQSAPQSP